jgi:hypothetical protein
MIENLVLQILYVGDDLRLLAILLGQNDLHISKFQYYLIKSQNQRLMPAQIMSGRDEPFIQGQDTQKWISSA